MKSSIFFMLCIFAVALLAIPIALADQTAGASVSGSIGSSATAINEQGGLIQNVGQQTINGAESVSNNAVQSVTINFPTGTYNVPLGDFGTDHALATVYMNEPIDIPLGEVPAGYGVNVSWMSSEPVLVYVTNNLTANSAIFDIAAAPIFNTVTRSFDIGEIPTYQQDTYFVSTINNGFGPHNQGVFVAPEDKSYDLIINSCPSEHQNSQINTGVVEDNSFDLAYDVGGVWPVNPSLNSPVTPVPTPDMYPIGPDGNPIIS